MSRLGNKPISLPGGVKAEIKGQAVKLTGPKGADEWSAPLPITVALEGAALVCKRPNDAAQTKALHGLTRSLLNNMVRGVHAGYEIPMEIYGTGYLVKLDGKNLLLNLGFMGRGVGKPAQFVMPLPAGVTVEVQVQAARGENEPAKFVIKGIDKQKVGQFAAEIRKLRKPEPYKGKGVRYSGEQIKRKAGKVFAGGGGG